MTKRAPVSMLILTSAFALGGCQIFKPSGVHSGASANAIRAGELASSTDQGRDHLRAGRYGLAIEAFERALAFGERPAPAYNGLGVAYAKLGRPELAYRFFRKAAMSDPDNPVYSRNLASLMDSPEFNLAVLQRSEPKGAKTGNKAEQKAAGPVARTPGKLYREKSGQFSLVTKVPDDEQSSLAAKPEPSPCLEKRNCDRVQLPRVASRKQSVISSAQIGEKAGQPEADAQSQKTRRKIVELPLANDAEATAKSVAATT